MDLLPALSALFGYTAFRPYQQEIITSLCRGQDVFAVMPTGGGKSLCYQLPAHVLHGVCVVISPLISLMKDQVENARANGLSAAYFNSTSTQAERRQLHHDLQDNTLDLLYISPERLGSAAFVNYMKQVNIAFFAIDEAHCISQWGHDFRPDYLALSLLAEEFPQCPVAAFTATATQQVTSDIIDQLHLRSPLEVRASFNRPNLYYQIMPKRDVKKQVLYVLRQYADESGIIYCSTRKKVDEYAAWLAEQGIKVRAYHAGLSEEERSLAQEDFRHDVCQVIVATVAFGMGIDKPNVRYVLHADMPRSMEAYYQETGRAGRDGSPARCVLFFDAQDIAQLLRFAAAEEDETRRDAAKAQIYAMLDFVQTDCCRRKSLLAYFGEDYAEHNCGACDVCTGEVARDDATQSAHLALQLIQASGCRFGKMYIVDLLMGVSSDRIVENGHTELAGFGAGKHATRKFWLFLLSALLTQGMTAIHDPEYPTLSITAKGKLFMRSDDHFFILQAAEKQLQRKQITKKLENEVSSYNAELFEALRSRRHELALAEHVPAYMIASDAVLRAMAALLPRNRRQMLEINGMGEKKWEKYGEIFLGVIDKHCRALPERRGTQA
ncbi:MAG: DNA helicase RecQ [Desulfovibrionaceae bacterium]|nr:DNA helicase RecQ [Desulfovibrionaceae bacterium]